MNSVVKEHPLIFSAPMVQANHAGRKRMTRRVINPQPFKSSLNWYCLKRGKHYQLSPVYAAHQDGSGIYPFGPEKLLGQCPFGVPGDRLWIRETFNISRLGELAPGEALGKNVDQCIADNNGFAVPCLDGVVYAADGVTEHPKYGKALWRPSIHMPRWACRDVYTVTKVRLERLQNISEAEAIAEGIQKSMGGMWCGAPHKAHGSPRQFNTAIEAFADLWDFLNGKKPSRAWKDNPWVWVVEYDNPLWKGSL